MFPKNSLVWNWRDNHITIPVKQPPIKWKWPRFSINKEKYLSIIKEYLRSSSLHGVHYIVDENRSLTERIFWIVKLGLIFALTFWFTTVTYVAYLDTPTTMTQIPTRRPITSVSFPAVTICDGNRMSKAAMWLMANSLFEIQNRTNTKIGPTVGHVYRALQHFGMFYNLYSDDNLFYELDTLHSFLLEAYNGSYKVFPLLQSMQAPCISILSNCKWHGQEVGCNKIFFSRRTFIGSCCAFNLQRPTATQLLSLQAAGLKVPPPKPILVHGPGVDSGLSAVIEHSTKDLGLVTQSNTASRVFIHDTANFANELTGSITEKLISPGEELHVSIHPKPVDGLELMRDIPPFSRGCVFDNEIHLVYDNFYSLSECILTCLIDDIIAFCRCYPVHLTPLYNNLSECQLSDVLCLQKWNYKWINVELPEDLEKRSARLLYCSHCLPPCRYISYNVQSSWGYISSPNLLGTKKDRNDSKFSILRVFFSGGHVIEYQQTIVSRWDELLSTFGNIFSFTMGASIISVFEMVYFLSGKFFTEFFKKLKPKWPKVHGRKKRANIKIEVAFQNHKELKLTKKKNPLKIYWREMRNPETLNKY